MRSRAPKNESYEPHDPFSYEVHPQTSSEFDENCYRSDGLSDGLIQIPDDDEDDGPLENSSHSFNGLNMGILKIPNGAAAAVAEPVLNEGSRKRIRLENDISRNGYITSSNHQGSNADINLDRSMDDDYHFLLSLHPYMTELSSSQKLRVRMKIQKLVFKELYKEDYDEDK